MATFKVARVDTWAAALQDKPGHLAGKLKALGSAGVNLEFVIARRRAEKPGKGVLFVTHIALDSSGDAAKAVRALKAL